MQSANSTMLEHNICRFLARHFTIWIRVQPSKINLDSNSNWPIVEGIPSLSGVLQVSEKDIHISMKTCF